MTNFPIIKSTKAWILISYLSKNMKLKCGIFFICLDGDANIENIVQKPCFSAKFRILIFCSLCMAYV